MLKGVTKTFIDGCNSKTLTYNEYIVIDNVTIPIEATLKDDCYNNGNFVGTFIFREISFETENNVDFKQKEFEYYKVINDESIKIGTFITTEVTDNDTSETVKVVGMDYGLKTQVEYISSLDYSSGLITLLDVWNECCTLSGLESGISSFANSDFIVDSDQFTGTGATIRDVFIAIAQSSCSFVKVMNDDKIYLLLNEETDDIIEDYTDLDDKRDTHPITCVRLGMSQITGENVDLKDEELAEEYGENWLIINDNPFAYTQEKRAQLITAILNKIKGFGYSSFTSKTSFKPYYTCGDVIKFKNKAGELVKSIILRYSHSGKEITLEAPSETSATVSYVYPVSAIDVAKRAEVIVNKHENTINALTQQTQNVQDNLNNNYYTKTNINNLLQTAETGITNTFSESGGNNILRNTGLWFKNDGEDSKKDKTIIGSNIKLFDALDETVNNVRINGYTRQITTTGDNFYTKDFSNVSSLIKEEDNDWFSYSYDHSAGTATTYSNLFTKASDLLKINTEYYCVVELKDVEITGNVTMTITDGVYSNEQFKTGFKIEKDDLQSKTIVIKELTTKDNFDGTTLLLRSFFALRAGSKISLKFRISLRGKTQTEDNFVYEPFSGGLPSPSPDYPQEVEVARGNNLFYVEPKTLNGVTLSYGKDGAIVLNGTATDFTQIKSSINLSNNTYTLSNISNKGFSKSLYVVTRDADGNLVQQLEVSNTTKVSLTSTSAISSCEITIIKGTNVDGVILQPQLQKGKVFTEYEQYNSIVAKSNGKNLFNKDNVNKINAYFSDIIYGNSANRVLWIPIEHNKTYTVSKKLGSVFATAFTIDEPKVGTVLYERTAQHTSTNKTMVNTSYNYLVVYYWASTDTLSEQEILDSIQIEEGTIATEYEPYQESKLTYSLNDNFLAEQDYIQDNKLYKNVAKVVLDGSENWEISSFTNDTILSVFLNVQNMKNSSEFKMNRFKYIPKVFNDTDYEYCATGGGSIRIGLYKSRLQSADIAGFKQWLSEHPVEVYYQLATPNIIDLEPSGELKTYKDYTSISNNVNTEMEINYNAIYSIYEFWTGNVKKETNSNSSSYNSLLLQRGSLKQEQDVPNGNYSISFTYKKLIELANATVKINENEYNLDSLEYKQFYTGQQDENGNYITSPIEVSSGHISIEFITDANNSVEVYDIMCNKGNVKLAWSQNENEVTTDTVNISKGITITSSYMETIFRANANGIQILTLQGETIAYFTEKGLTTKEAIIEEKAEICGTLITDVGNQTWFTRM